MAFAMACAVAYGDLPTVADDPLSQSVLSGHPVVLRARIDPPQPAGVTWWKDGERLDGQTRFLLEINNVGPEHQGYYRALIRNGEGATWTREAFLRVIHPQVAPGVRDRDFHPPALDDDKDEDNDDVRALVPLHDGKVIVGGEFDFGGGLLRLHPDGEVDTSFNPGGSGPNDKVRALLQTENGLLVGGDFTRYNGQSARSIVLLDDTGRPVAGFRSDLGFDNDVLDLAELPDGRLLVAGKFRRAYSDIGSRTALYIARLFPDGRPDPSFAATPVDGGPVESFAVDGQGRIVAGGSFTLVAGVDAPRIARLLPDGERDWTFTTGAVESGIVTSLAIGDGGKIYVGGGFLGIQGFSREGFARLEPNGAVDEGFRMDASEPVRSLAFDPHGRLHIGGRFVELGGHALRRIARLDAEGLPDLSFEVHGLNEGVRTVAFDAGGKVLIGGQFKLPARRLVRVHSEDGPRTRPSLLAAPVISESWLGERVRLRALADGGGDMIYDWYRDGQLIPYANKEELSVEALSKNDAGRYSVRISNSAGQVDSAPVGVRPRPKLPSAGRNLFVRGSDHGIPAGITTAATLIAVDEIESIGAVVVEVELDHPNLFDVQLTLVAPDGTEVVLLPAACMSARYLFSTRFDDRANATILQAEPPAAGVFQALGDLSEFVGKSMLGTWELRVADSRDEGEPGNLLDWGIEFHQSPATPTFDRYAEHFDSDDWLRFALGRTPDQPGFGLLPSVGQQGFQLVHQRWPAEVGIQYRYESLESDGLGWLPRDAVVHDLHRFPDGLERVFLTLPTDDRAPLFRVAADPTP